MRENQRQLNPNFRGGKNSAPQHQWSQKIVRSPERMKIRKKRGKTKKLKNGNSIYVKIPKIHFNDSRYKTILGPYQTTLFGREDVAYKS